MVFNFGNIPKDLVNDVLGLITDAYKYVTNEELGNDLDINCVLGVFQENTIKHDKYFAIPTIRYHKMSVTYEINNGSLTYIYFACCFILSVFYLSTISSLVCN